MNSPLLGKNKPIGVTASSDANSGLQEWIIRLNPWTALTTDC